MKTFNDILIKHIGHNFYFDLNTDQLNALFDAMNEAVIQDRKNVAEHAKLNYTSQKGSVGFSGYSRLDKDSIINAPKALYK